MVKWKVRREGTIKKVAARDEYKDMLGKR